LIKRIFTPLLILLILLSSLNIYVTAKPELTAWTTNPPSIDGIASTGEWNAAAQESFTLLDLPATIYVMNDEDNLYILVKIGPDDDTDSHDTCGVYFDNDNGGGAILANGDDALRISIVGFEDLYWNSTLFWDNLQSDGTQNQDGYGIGCQDDTKTWYFEFSHPLNSPDDTHDFSISIGDSLGFAISFADWEESDFTLDFWPGEWNVPDGYSQIIIADESQTSKVSDLNPVVFFALIAVSAVSIGSIGIFFWRNRQKKPAYCPNCGSKLMKGYTFCQRCGRRLKPI